MGSQTSRGGRESPEDVILYLRLLRVMVAATLAGQRSPLKASVLTFHWRATEHWLFREGRERR